MASSALPAPVTAHYYLTAQTDIPGTSVTGSFDFTMDQLNGGTSSFSNWDIIVASIPLAGYDPLPAVEFSSAQGGIIANQNYGAQVLFRQGTGDYLTLTFAGTGGYSHGGIGDLPVFDTLISGVDYSHYLNANQPFFVEEQATFGRPEITISGVVSTDGPEPATWTMFGLAGAAAFFSRRKLAAKSV